MTNIQEVEPLWPSDRFSYNGSHDGYFGLTTDKLSYFVSRELLEEQPNVLSEYCLQITEWLKSRKGENNLLIATTTIGDIARFPIPSMTERLNRLLRRIAELSSHTTESVTLHGDGDETKIYQLMRDISLASYTDLKSILVHLEYRGLVDATIGQGWIKASITINGLLYLDSLELDRKESRTCFVAMWFSEEMSEIYQSSIAPAIEKSGYMPIRIDKKEHNNKIDDEIISEIRRAKFVVSDFSCGVDGARGGVYFEAGFAYGLNIPVIFCVRESDLSRVHFDTRQFSHIVWKDGSDLENRLASRIQATII